MKTKQLEQTTDDWIVSTKCPIRETCEQRDNPDIAKPCNLDVYYTCPFYNGKEVKYEN